MGKLIIVYIRYVTDNSGNQPAVSGFPIAANGKVTLANGTRSADDTFAYMYMGANTTYFVLPNALKATNSRYMFTCAYVSA